MPAPKVTDRAQGRCQSRQQAGQRRALHDAAIEARQCSACCLAHGADVGLADGRGYIRRLDAAIGGDADVLGLLLEHGADIGRTGNNGETALHIVADYGT